MYSFYKKGKSSEVMHSLFNKDYSVILGASSSSSRPPSQHMELMLTRFCSSRWVFIMFIMFVCGGQRVLQFIVTGNYHISIRLLAAIVAASFNVAIDQNIWKCYIV